MKQKTHKAMQLVHKKVQHMPGRFKVSTSLLSIYILVMTGE